MKNSELNSINSLINSSDPEIRKLGFDMISYPCYTVTKVSNEGFGGRSGIIYIDTYLFQKVTSFKLSKHCECVQTSGDNIFKIKFHNGINYPISQDNINACMYYNSAKIKLLTKKEFEEYVSRKKDISIQNF